MRPARGFTLVEMVVVVAIVGVLAMAARPLLELSHRRAQEFALRDALRQIRGALDAHRRAAEAGRITLAPGASGYPATLDVLVSGVIDASSSADGKRIYFLRRLPRDPFSAPELTAAETWALRSHDSPPDDPRPGEDVFDVASRSTAMALDGTPYASW